MFEQNEVPTITQVIQKNEGYINFRQAGGVELSFETAAVSFCTAQFYFQLYCYVSHLLNLFSYTTSTPVIPASQQNLSP